MSCLIAAVGESPQIGRFRRAMTAVRIDGKALALKVRAQVAEDVEAFGRPGLPRDDPRRRRPGLARLRRQKHKASHEAGIDSRDHRFPDDTPERDVLDLIAELNADDAVDGILVQLPLPEHMDEPRCSALSIRRRTSTASTPSNAGRLYLGEPFLVPATPSGRHGDARRARGRAEGQGGGRDRAERDRRQADGDAPPRGARDGDHLPLADARSRRSTRGGRTSWSRPSGGRAS